MNHKTTSSLYRPSAKNISKPLPLYLSKISAGFPSPADDFVEDTIDINEYLISNRPATYLVRVTGDSMEGAAICEGDILVVDASLKPTDQKIVVASVEGEFTVKRFCIEKEGIFLKAENPEYAPIKIASTDEFSILGVVVGMIRKIK
jgi:DNA polymerase V